MNPVAFARFTHFASSVLFTKFMWHFVGCDVDPRVFHNFSKVCV